MIMSLYFLQVFVMNLSTARPNLVLLSVVGKISRNVDSVVHI